MKVLKLSDFKGGWLVGNFDPSLHKQQGVEVAVKRYAAGDGEKAHVHKIGTEITVVVDGCARMGDVVLNPGDVAVLEPGEPMPGDWYVTRPTTTVCIKFPSAPGDKYPL